MKNNIKITKQQHKISKTKYSKYRPGAFSPAREKAPAWRAMGPFPWAYIHVFFFWNFNEDEMKNNIKIKKQQHKISKTKYSKSARGLFPCKGKGPRLEGHGAFPLGLYSCKYVKELKIFKNQKA